MLIMLIGLPENWKKKKQQQRMYLSDAEIVQEEAYVVSSI